MALKIWKGPTNALVFAPTTGGLIGGDRVRTTDVYRGPLALCQNSVLARGTFGSGFRSGWVVNQSYCSNERGGIGTLTHEWEAGGAYATAPLPIGDFALEPQELYPKIERAGCFVGITFATLNVAYNCLYLATNSSGTPLVTSTFLTTNITDPTQLALAQNLVAKLLRGEETFYLAGWRYWYDFYSYTVPALSAGAKIVTPDGPLSGNLPAGTTWLRLADKCSPAGVNGSMFKITRSYIGGPTMGGVNYWDSDVYP